MCLVFSEINRIARESHRSITVNNSDVDVLNAQISLIAKRQGAKHFDLCHACQDEERIKQENIGAAMRSL